MIPLIGTTLSPRRARCGGKRAVGLPPHPAPRHLWRRDGRASTPLKVIAAASGTLPMHPLSASMRARELSGAWNWKSTDQRGRPGAPKERRRLPLGSTCQPGLPSRWGRSRKKRQLRLVASWRHGDSDTAPQRGSRPKRDSWANPHPTLPRNIPERWLLARTDAAQIEGSSRSGTSPEFRAPRATMRASRS
jgi:hypothetical protein